MDSNRQIEEITSIITKSKSLGLLELYRTDADTAKEIYDAGFHKSEGDTVDVVRCKNCAYWGGTTYGFVCRKFSGIENKICMSADHYCSFGERKENGKQAG